jgi:hypothetical protein
MTVLLGICNCIHSIAFPLKMFFQDVLRSDRISPLVQLGERAKLTLLRGICLSFTSESKPLLMLHYKPIFSRILLLPVVSSVRPKFPSPSRIRVRGICLIPLN